MLSIKSNSFELSTYANKNGKDWCWSWNSNTLATWCKDLIHWKKTLMLGKIKGRRRRGPHRMRWFDDITNSRWAWVWVSSGSWWWQVSLACCCSWGCKELDTNKPLNWTKKNYLESPPFVMSPKVLNKYHLIVKWRIRNSNKRRHSGKLWVEKNTENTDRHRADKSAQVTPFVAAQEQQE